MHGENTKIQDPKQVLYRKKRDLLRIPFVEIAKAVGRTSATVEGILGCRIGQFFSGETKQKVYDFIDQYEKQLWENLNRLSGGAVE